MLCDGIWCWLWAVQYYWLLWGVPAGFVLAAVSGVWWYRWAKAHEPGLWVPRLLVVIGITLIAYPGMVYARFWYDNYQYNLKKRAVLAELPFTVYRANYVPEGYEITNYNIREYFTGPEDAVVKATIRIPGSTFASHFVSTAYASHYAEEVWAEIHQMQSLPSYPTACPGWYFTLEYPRRTFEEPCTLVAETRHGQPVYQTELGTVMFPQQARISVTIDGTLIVFSIPHELEAGQLNDIIAIIESLEAMPSEVLVAQAD